MSSNEIPARPVIRTTTAHSERELRAEIDGLLDDPKHADNPLRTPLTRLLSLYDSHRSRLERLVSISDGYHTLTHTQTLSLTEQYDRQLRRLEKLARISDRYQNSLREVSEALREASMHDPMTGLTNRRFLMERLNEESERAKRRQTPYAVAMIDVDFFKAVNDQHGHDAGDQVLCEIARAIRGALRKYDVCGRWGGEEFLVILPEAPIDVARQVGERIRRDVREIQLDFLEPGVTVSMGLAMHEIGEPYGETIKRADDAMFKAKSAGRDRLELG